MKMLMHLLLIAGLMFLGLGVKAITYAGEEGIVQFSSNDETFVIQTQWGEQVFKATTYCFNIQQNDSVYFLDSTGVCVSNSFIVKRTGYKCDVWCE